MLFNYVNWVLYYLDLIFVIFWWYSLVIFKVHCMISTIFTTIWYFCDFCNFFMILCDVRLLQLLILLWFLSCVCLCFIWCGREVYGGWSQFEKYKLTHSKEKHLVYTECIERVIWPLLTHPPLTSYSWLTVPYVGNLTPPPPPFDPHKVLLHR